MSEAQPLMVPFREHLYPLLHGYRRLADDLCNRSSTRRDELNYRRRVGRVDEGFDFATAWEDAMREREQHRLAPPDNG